MNDKDLRKKILIIDDVPENIRILIEVLKDDYAILAAKDGEKGLELATKEVRPNIILLDIMMPGLDGYEVCKRLKANPLTREIPIIFITALNDAVNEKLALEIGGIDFITKPINPQLVRSRIKNHLALADAIELLKEQNINLIEAAQLREDVDRITKHDLKSPLNGIIGFPELMMMDENLTDEQRKTLNHIKELGYKMLEMINSSLDLYRMETGKYHYQPTKVNIKEIIENIFIDLKSLADRNEIRLETVFAAEGKNKTMEPAIVRGEKLLCYSMLSNLIKNAIEASPEKSPVRVFFERDMDHAIIKIHNRGMVPEHIQNKFFDKYTTSGKKHGTGLGTYSAMLAAKTQEGDIAMKTSQDMGTEVSVRLKKSG